MGSSVVELDELPEPIIQHTLSFLTGKEAAQTTLLSKSWRSAWLTQPNLAFEIGSGDYGTQILELARKTIQRYEESNLKIQGLTLLVDSCLKEDEIVLCNELIANSLKLGATHLNLNLGNYFVLPHDHIVFGSEKLVRLSVGRCKIEIGSSGRKVNRCSGLESLSLICTKISLDTLSNIISNCPSIRKLSLSHISGFEEEEGVNRSVGLTSLHSLTRLELIKVNLDALFFGGVSFRFPSLKDLTLHTYSYRYPSPMDMTHNTLSNIISSCPSIRNLSWSHEGEEGVEGVEDVIIRSVGLGPMINLQSLTRLELFYVKLDTLFLGDMSSRFPSLKDLTLHTRSFSQDKEIQISSRSLERLNFAQEKGAKRVWYKFDGLKRVRFKFDVPSIRRFTYKGRDSPPFSIKTTSRGWESHISIGGDKKLDSLWFRRLNKFLKKLKRSKIHLSLNVFCWKSFDYDAGEIQGLCSRRPRVENLAVYVGYLPTLSCYAFFDGLFQICRPTFITQCLRHGKGKNECFLFRKLVERVGNEKCSVQDHFMYRGLLDLEEMDVAIFNKADGGVWRVVPLESFLDDDDLKAVLVAAPDDYDDEHGLLVREEVKVRFQLKWKR